MGNLRTPLLDWHASHGARIVEFVGWDMPLLYTGIVEEHLAVRRAAGLFDVSHMGKLVIEGPGAPALVNALSTNDIPATPGRARYTHLLDDEGRILDDVIFTCLAPDRYLCVCTAGPRARATGHRAAREGVPPLRPGLHGAGDEPGDGLGVAREVGPSVRRAGGPPRAEGARRVPAAGRAPAPRARGPPPRLPGPRGRPGGRPRDERDPVPLP